MAERSLRAAGERPFVGVVGATATGKSALALRLAEHVGGEIVNADALQVYRGLDIGTAKPTPAEREAVPHHLLDIVDPEERFSAGEFARLARAAIGDIRSRGALPIVVGGSGLYLRALLRGIAPIPPADPEVREQLRRRAEEEGLEGLREELRDLDPASWERLPAGDTQRILRALEVVRVTGSPQSLWIEQNPFDLRVLPAIQVGLTLPRDVLYDRIERRVERMVALGWVEEVRGLLAAGFARDLPAFQAIGYRQLARFVEGQGTLSEAIEDTVRATRRFAKRQETWFRKEPGVTWFDGRLPDAAASGSLALLEGKSR